MKKNNKKKIIAIIAILIILINLVGISANVNAAGKIKTIKETIKPIGGQKGCKLWAQDTISYKVQDGKIVSKPTVTSKVSTANKLLGLNGLGQYYKLKDPTISYKKGSKTATIKTYWGFKHGVNIQGLKI